MRAREYREDDNPTRVVLLYCAVEGPTVGVLTARELILYEETSDESRVVCVPASRKYLEKS